MSPVSCPPSTPSGSVIGQSDEAFSAANGGLQYLQYPNSQFILQDDSSGPFFVDLSSSSSVAASDMDGNTLILNIDGTFQLFVSSCELEIVGAWLTSSNRKRMELGRRQILSVLCNAVEFFCTSPIAADLISLFEKGACSLIGVEVGEAIGGGIGFLGNIFGPEVGIPATIAGIILGGRIGPDLCEFAIDQLSGLLCEACQNSPTSTVTAEATYTAASGACSTSQSLGMAIFCCSGSCIDGTEIFSPGLCENLLDLCLDVESGPPSCSSGQVLNPGSATGVDSGNGGCWFGNDCVWQQNDWSWACCDCPNGYVSITGGACGSPPTFPCVGCDSGEVLAGDSTNGYYCIITEEA